MIYEVIGYERRSGTARRTGKAYDMEVLHCKGNELTYDGTYGVEVEKILINRILNPAPVSPVPIGSHIRVYYNRSGYPQDYEVVD